MECHDALNVLIESKTDRAGEARMHVINCPVCLSRIDQLARAILSTDEDEISCAECRARLPAYREAEERDKEMGVQFSAVTSHLARCPYCAEEYRALQEAMAAWNTGTLVELTQPPEFDLSFLEPTPARRPLWLSETAGRVRVLFSEITITLGTRLASFASLPSPLVPRPAPVGLFRYRDVFAHEKAVGEGQAQEILALPDEENNVVIRLGVGPVVRDGGILTIEVGQLSPDVPIEQAKVTLCEADGSLLESTATDSDGRAIFRDLEVGQYRIGVEHNQKTWHLLVTVASPYQ